MNDTNKTIHLFGVNFCALTQDVATARVLSWATPANPKPRTVITVNVAILMMMRSDPALRAAIERADLVVADGMPLVWASKWLSRPLPERVTGIDLMSAALERGGRRRLRIFLLGTTPERLNRLRTVIMERYPSVDIVGARDGYFKKDQEADVIGEIRTSRPDILFVGMPAPFKEVWCERHRDELGASVILGVGGAFDVLAGFLPRAPVLMQRSGLEWTWRLAREPRKLWKRYLVTNTQFVVLLARELAGARVNADT